MQRRSPLVVVAAAVAAALLCIIAATQTQAASQMPGMPTPFDSAHACCSGSSLLPRDKYILTAGMSVYEYNPIMQNTTYLYSIIDQFSPPVGTGISFGGTQTCANSTLSLQGGVNLVAFNSATWWTNDRGYWFFGSNYWRFKRYADPDENGAAGPSVTSSGWATGINNLDGWLNADAHWSYVFVNSTVAQYNNREDRQDFSEGFPKPIAEAFPGLPNQQSDSDISLGGTEWFVWKGDEVWKYHQYQKTIYPGYPKAIHDDAADGGSFGEGRTRCSGVMDLVTAIGFVQDKSPGAPYESMVYADNLSCRWVLNLPDVLLRQTAAGVTWPGVSLRFTRFDLGDGASVKIWNNNDMPSPEIMLSHSTVHYNADTRNYFPDDRYTVAQGPLEIQAHNPSLAHSFDQSNQPALGQAINVGGTGSQSITIEFTTGVDPLAIHTGFALEFAVPTPAHTVYSERSGVFWFSSLHTTGVQTAILHPRDLESQSLKYQEVSISLALRMYPNNVAAYWDQVAVEAFSVTTGMSIQNCTGAALFLRGYNEPRCKITAAGPVRLVYTTSSSSFVGLALGEFRWNGFCNAPATDPVRLSNLTGTITDGSGAFNRYRGNSDCRWRLEAEDPDVLFITVKPTEFLLFNDDSLRAFDGLNSSAPLIDQPWSGFILNGLFPLYRSTGPRMALWFQSTRHGLGEGFNLRYTMIFPPITSSLSIAGFAPLEITSFEGLSTLAALGSSASAILYAGVSRASLTITGRDKYDQPAALEFDDAFGFTLRFIPHALTADATRRAALQSYPRTLRETNNVTWAALGVTITDAELASIVEYQFVGARLEFVAPQRGGIDYLVSLLYVIWAPSVSAISGMATYAPGVFTAIPYTQIIRVTAFKADSAHSSFFFERSIPFSAVSARALVPDTHSRRLLTTPPCLPGDLCNSGSSGANGNFTVGDTSLFRLVTRDQFDNQMENLGEGSGDDVRAFMQSLSIASSPPASLVRVAPGSYELRLTPTVAGADYKLTVLVSGSDVSEGPFSPLLLPGPTDAAASTIVCASTGLSVLSYPLPLGSAVPIVVTLRDRWGNPQRAEIADGDAAVFDWPGKGLQLVSRNGSEITYTVSLGRFEPASRMSYRINGQPLGYNPASRATAAFATGITVAIGNPEITMYEQPNSVRIGLVLMAAQCMALTVALLLYIHYCRSLAPIRAAAPTFLQLMLVGAIFLYASIIPIAEPVPSSASCALVPLLGHLGFFLVFGSLFVKTHRVRTIFQAKKLQVRIISDVQLLGRLAVGVLVFLVYYAIWMSVAPPEPAVVHRDYDGYGVCASDQSVFSILILIVEALFVVYGAYLSASIWSLPSQFNESKQLLVAIYNVAVIGGLLLLLVKGILTDPRMQLLFSAIGILIVTTVVILCIFVQKLAILWSPRFKHVKAHDAHTFGVGVGTVTLPSIIEEGNHSISPEGPQKPQLQPRSSFGGGDNNTAPERGALKSAGVVRVHTEPQGGNAAGLDASAFTHTHTQAGAAVSEQLPSPNQPLRPFMVQPQGSSKSAVYSMGSTEGRAGRLPKLTQAPGQPRAIGSPISPTVAGELTPSSPQAGEGAAVSSLGARAGPSFHPDYPAPQLVSQLSDPNLISPVGGERIIPKRQGDSAGDHSSGPNTVASSAAGVSSGSVPGEITDDSVPSGARDSPAANTAEGAQQ